MGDDRLRSGRRPVTPATSPMFEERSGRLA